MKISHRCRRSHLILVTSLRSPTSYSGFQVHEVQIPRFWGVGSGEWGVGKKIKIPHLFEEGYREIRDLGMKFI